MAQRNYQPGEIITKLREAEVHLADGKSVKEAARRISVSVYILQGVVWSFPVRR